MKRKIKTDANGFYKNRRDQIEDELRLYRAAKSDKRLLELMCSTAFIGACGERDHVLEIIDRAIGLELSMRQALRDAICEKSVLEVLGY